VDDYLGHLREFRRILRNLESQTSHPLNRETIVALSQKLDRDESQLNADRLERSIRATVEATRSLEDLEHYQQDVMSVFHEIITRKRRELERERFRKLLDQSGEAILVVDPFTGRFVDVNQTAARILGYSRDELLELSLNHIEVGLPLTPSNAWQDWVEGLRGTTDVVFLEGVHRRKDGTRFPVEESVGLAIVDGQELLLVASRDITERKRSETRLRRQWAFFSRLVHRSVDGIMAFDRSFNVTYWNPAMERILGVHKNQILGKNAFQVLPRLKELGEDRYFRDALAGTTASSRNRPYTHAETGRQIHFDGHYSPLTEETGEILGGIGILRDVTERRETQVRQARDAMVRLDQQRLAQLEVERRLAGEIDELKRENQKLSDARMRSFEREEVKISERVEGLEILAGGIAREVAPLMAGILGQTGVALAELPVDSPLRRGVEEIEQAALSASALASMLSAFSGNGRADSHRVQLDDLLIELEHSLRSTLPPNVTLKLPEQRVEASPLPLVRGDARQLREMILALVSNASEAMADEGGEIRIVTGVAEIDTESLAQAYLGKDKVEGNYVYLEVEDEGEGISEEERKKIFVPLFTTKSGHRGLGLASVLGVLRAHGGAMIVESAPAQGSKFRALFPMP
jgi:two-component system cell cycle sensor histidine kinase/response regulator CckA